MPAFQCSGFLQILCVCVWKNDSVKVFAKVENASVTAFLLSGLWSVFRWCHHAHRFNELATKNEKWTGKPKLECVDGRHPSSKTVDVLPWTCRSEGKWRSRQTGGQSNPHNWLASRKIWSFEELETLPAGTKPRNHTTDHLAKRGVERGSARWSSLKGRERAIVNQTNVGTVSEATLGKPERA